MFGRFFALGSLGTGDVGLSLPFGDGAPEGVTATTLTLPTTASVVANFFTGLVAYVIAGSGIGQWRSIQAYTTARVATVRTWDAPVPNTASTVVYGVQLRYADIVHYRSEYTTLTGASGLFRADAFIEDASTPQRIFSPVFQFARIPITSGLVASGTTAHGETKVADLMPLNSIVGKIYCETAPTAGSVTVYAASGSSGGRSRP